MSSQKSGVLNVLFHFRNRLDVPSPPSPDGLPALETSSASSFLYASGRPQRSARTAPARLSHTRAASVRSRPHRTHEGTPGRSAARPLPVPDSRAAAPPHPYRNRTAASYSHALSFPLSPCMMIPEAKSTFSFLFDSVVKYIQILWDFLLSPVALTTS